MRYITILLILVSGTCFGQTEYSDIVFGNKSMITKLPKYVVVKHNKNGGFKGTYCSSGKCSVEVTYLDAKKPEIALALLEDLAGEDGARATKVGENIVVQMPTGLDSENGNEYEFIHFTLASGSGIANITIKSPTKSERTEEMAPLINTVVNSVLKTTKGI